MQRNGINVTFPTGKKGQPPAREKALIESLLTWLFNIKGMPKGKYTLSWIPGIPRKANERPDQEALVLTPGEPKLTDTGKVALEVFSSVTGGYHSAYCQLPGRKTKRESAFAKICKEIERSNQANNGPADSNDESDDQGTPLPPSPLPDAPEITQPEEGSDTSSDTNGKVMIREDAGSPELEAVMDRLLDETTLSGSVRWIEIGQLPGDNSPEGTVSLIGVPTLSMELTFTKEGQRHVKRAEIHLGSLAKSIIDKSLQ